LLTGTPLVSAALFRLFVSAAKFSQFLLDSHNQGRGRPPRIT